jgi:hypothetical protein
MIIFRNLPTGMLMVTFRLFLTELSSNEFSINIEHLLRLLRYFLTLTPKGRNSIAGGVVPGSKYNSPTGLSNDNNDSYRINETTVKEAISSADMPEKE